MADLNLKPEEVAGKVSELRTCFKEKFSENIKNGVYDQRDLDRLDKDDAHARTFLRTLGANGDVAKAVDLVDDCFKFRKSIGLWDLNIDDFPDEIKDRNAIYFKGEDKKGHPIFYINVKENVAPIEHMPLLKQYIAWSIEQHHSRNPEQMCVVLMDMGSADVTNLGVEIIKYLMACFTNYFPVFLAYLINYNMPTILSATFSTISTCLDNEQKQKFLSVKKSEIMNYIAHEHLWPHMK